jgi:hypothetical protein
MLQRYIFDLGDLAYPPSAAAVAVVYNFPYVRSPPKKKKPLCPTSTT